MSRWIVMPSLLLVCVTPVGAQTSARPMDPVFARAQALVSDGNGVAGRALIDSMLAATPPSAPLYPQALFWRASLAASAADAESDYRHIVVDYPLAPQAEDALLRLAQLELARGDRDGALIHLQRIQRDYPHSRSLARASYWTARVLFEKNDLPSACAANAAALSQSDPSEVELRNQIQYQGQRCPAPAAPAAPAASAVAATPVSAARAESTSVTTSSPSVATTSSSSVSAPATASPAVPSTSAAAKPVNVSADPVYSVQVAAYNHKPDAEQLAATLTKRGYAARVDGTVAPFRVRIGRYATSSEAEDALKKIKAKHMDGFVARVSER